MTSGNSDQALVQLLLPTVFFHAEESHCTLLGFTYTSANHSNESASSKHMHFFNYAVDEAFLQVHIHVEPFNEEEDNAFHDRLFSLYSIRQSQKGTSMWGPRMRWRTEEAGLAPTKRRVQPMSANQEPLWGQA